MLIRRLVLAILAVLAAVIPARAQSPQPVVVELFTSQGCSSCPPADAFLGQLARRDDIIALSFHVTYWDYIGWKDRFGSEAATQRQSNYATAFRSGFVYTPQMVINGSTHEVGSRRSEINRAIEQAARADGKRLDVVLAWQDDRRLSVTIPASDYAGEADIWLVLFDDARSTEIHAGENRGRTITYHHVVRDIKRIGGWTGAATTIPVDMPAAQGERRDGCVVIVQPRDMAGILGAAYVPMP